MGLLAQVCQAQAIQLQGIRSSHTRSTGIGEDCHVPALGQRTPCQRPRPLEHFLGSIGAQHPRLAKSRIKSGFLPGEGAGMGCSSTLACFKPAHLEGNDRLGGGDAAGSFHETLPIADTLHVHRQNPGVGILRHRFQHIGFIYVRLVTQADQVGESKSLPAHPIHHSCANGSGMRDKGGVSNRRQRRLQEGGIHGQVGIGNPNTVGSNKTDAVLAGNFHQLIFQGSPFGTSFPKTACGDNGGTNPTLTHLPHGIRNEGRWNQDDCQFHRIRHIGNAGVHGVTQQGAAPGVDKMDCPGIPGANQVTRQGIAQLGGVLGCTHHHHPRRGKKRSKGRISHENSFFTCQPSVKEYKPKIFQIIIMESMIHIHENPPIQSWSACHAK